MIVYLMGVSGSGKSTIGKQLAERMGWAFADGDDFHSAANKAKMGGGHPLSDEDRWPWLQAINAFAREKTTTGASAVIACSALKAVYRELLAEGLADTRFVMLTGPKELIADRLAQRHHEYMKGDLLDSQLATLEPPKDAICIVNDASVDEVVERIVKRLQETSDAR